MMFFPFVKPLYQNESLLNNQPSANISIFFNKITFTSYFFTYVYDGK